MARWAPLVFIVLLIVVFSIMLPRDPSELPSTYIDKAAPGFDLPTLKDPAVRVSSADYSGKNVLVNVWASRGFSRLGFAEAEKRSFSLNPCRSTPPGWRVALDR